MATLKEWNTQILTQKHAICALQVQTILHSAYVEDLRGQLEGKEQKKAHAKDRGRINTDGLQILTQDDIFNCVQQAHEHCDAIQNAATRWKDAKSIWNVREADRKERNKGLTTEWKRETKKWEDEQNRARCEQKKPHWNKPKKPAMEKAIMKLKLADFLEDCSEDEEVGVEVDEGNDKELDISDGGDSDWVVSTKNHSKRKCDKWPIDCGLADIIQYIVYI